MHKNKVISIYYVLQAIIYRTTHVHELFEPTLTMHDAGKQKTHESRQIDEF